MTGLRERKKAQTRQRIADVAMRLFAERGFDAVTVNEIAEAAQVAKATLFTYFPSKESLALDGVGQDDLAGVVARRASEQTPLQALRAHFVAFATQGLADVDGQGLTARLQVIASSPALSQAATVLQYRERAALARELTPDYGPMGAVLAAAQITGSLHALQESFFQRFAGGASPESAGRALASDVDLAFDLLEHGLGHPGGH